MRGERGVEMALGDLQDLRREKVKYVVVPTIEPMSGSNSGWAILREPRFQSYDLRGRGDVTRVNQKFADAIGPFAGDYGDGYIVCQMEKIGAIIETLSAFPPVPVIDQE